MLHFKPNRHERIERRKEKRSIKQPNRNQPEPKVWVLSIRDLKPRDQVWWYRFSMDNKFDLDTFAKKLGVALGVDLVVAPYLNYIYDVWLAAPVEWITVEKQTLKLLEEIE